MKFNNISQIGIVGGGVSALMLCVEAAKLGISTCLLDPNIDAIGARVASDHIIGSISMENIKKLSLRCDYLIFNTKVEFKLDSKLHCPIYPCKESLDEIASEKNILQAAEMVGIPVIKTYYFNKIREVFSPSNEIGFPLKLIKQYSDDSGYIDIQEVEDLPELLSMREDEATCIMVQPIPKYCQTISCICLVQESGKITLYDPMQISYDEEEICHLKLGNCFSNHMITRLNRYNKKLLKELNFVGVCSVRYGVKSNKSIEFIEMTPELGVASLLTIEGYQNSIFESYIRMIVGLKVKVNPLRHKVHGIIEEGEVSQPEGKVYTIDEYTLVINEEDEVI